MLRIARGCSCRDLRLNGLRLHINHRHVVERLKLCSAFLARQVEILELKGKIQSEVKSEMDKTQREYILREQLKAIQQELADVGCYPGAVDGVIGAKTDAAILEFQTAAGLTADGELNPRVPFSWMRINIMVSFMVVMKKGVVAEPKGAAQQGAGLQY